MTLEYSKIRVVYVDDDPDTLALVKVRLDADPGIELLGFGQNGREAIQLANRHRPDVMILDIHMPVMNGLEAGARIAKAFPSIGLVMLTADESLDSIKSAFLHAHAIAYLDKTTEIAKVGSAVREADARRDRTAAPRGSGTIWSFYGPQGRSGATTLAINSAIELANMGYRTLLVDLDTMHGSVAFHLRAERDAQGPNLFLDLPRLTDPLDADVMTPYMRKLPTTMGASELRVLYSPTTFVSDSIEHAANLRRCVEVWEQMFDYIVLDVPSGRIFTELNILALEASERLFVSCHHDLIGVKNLWDFVKLLRDVSFSPGRMSLLFSGLASLHATNYRQWLESREIPSGAVEVLPVDDSQAERSLSKGLPAVVDDPNSTLARFVRDLVTRSLNFQPLAPEGKSQSIFSRLRGLLAG